MGGTSIRFLLDSGAAVSVVRYDSLDERLHEQVKRQFEPEHYSSEWPSFGGCWKYHSFCITRKILS